MDATRLAERVGMLEGTVRALVTMPARMAGLEGRLATVEMQIVQLRAEMQGEFSAIRGDLRGLNERFDALYERGEDTRRYMRVLHEEVLDRMARLGEGRGAL